MNYLCFKVCINNICWLHFRICSGTDHQHSWCFMRWCSTSLGWNIAHLRLFYYFFSVVHLSYLLLNVRYVMMSFSRVSSFSDWLLVPEKEYKHATKLYFNNHHNLICMICLAGSCYCSFCPLFLVCFCFSDINELEAFIYSIDCLL